MKKRLPLISRRDKDEVIDFEFLLSSAIESVNNMRDASGQVSHPIGRLVYAMELDELNERLTGLTKFLDWSPGKEQKKSKRLTRKGEWFE